MRKILITLAIFFAMSGAAHADPIFSPIFLAIFGANATIFGLQVAAIASAIATAASGRLVTWRRREKP